MIYNIDFEIR